MAMMQCLVRMRVSYVVINRRGWVSSPSPVVRTPPPPQVKKKLCWATRKREREKFALPWKTIISCVLWINAREERNITFSPCEEWKGRNKNTAKNVKHEFSLTFFWNLCQVATRDGMWYHPRRLKMRNKLVSCNCAREYVNKCISTFDDRLFIKCSWRPDIKKEVQPPRVQQGLIMGLRYKCSVKALRRNTVVQYSIVEVSVPQLAIYKNGEWLYSNVKTGSLSILVFTLDWNWWSSIPKRFMRCEAVWGSWWSERLYRFQHSLLPIPFLNSLSKAELSLDNVISTTPPPCIWTWIKLKLLWLHSVWEKEKEKRLE